MSDIATKFIFVFDCVEDMDVFHQMHEFVRTIYSNFALYFMVALPAEYTAGDYMAYLNRKYAKYLNMSDSDFRIDELKVNSKILYTPREVEVKIKRKKDKDVKVILELPDGKAAIEFGEIGKKKIQHFNNDVKLYSYWFTLKVLGEEGKGPIYSYLFGIFGDLLIKEKYYLKNTEIIYGDYETYRFEFERRNEMKNMFFDNFTEPVFADYEPIIGRIITKGEPEITLRDFHLEPSDAQYPSVQMKFNISPGVITKDMQFSIRRYLDDNFYKCIPRNSGRYPFKESWYGVQPLNGGYMKKAPLTFKLYSGVERSTQRYKTICVWEDGEKTTIYRDKPVNGGPVTRAFAWCYVKRTFGTVSHFKKHVDKRTTKIGGVIYFEGDCLQDEYAQASVGQDWIQYDIYDAAALAITAKRYGGLKKLNDDYIQKAVDIDADLSAAEEGFKTTSEMAEAVTKTLNSLSEVFDDTKKKKTKKSNK